MVYKPDKKVCGCVWLEPVGDHAWYLGSLAIDPDMQNARLGRRLMASAENHVRQRGGRTVKMTVIDARATLLAWYQRQGYELTGASEPFPMDDTRFGTPTRPCLRFVTLAKTVGR